MPDSKTPVSVEDPPSELPVEWQERAEQAARRFGLQLPAENDLRSAAEAEQRLREFEQEGGE